ncbi:MAG: hypothetical protein WBQ68_08550 [Terriglobales bacterium]
MLRQFGDSACECLRIILFDYLSAQAAQFVDAHDLPHLGGSKENSDAITGAQVGFLFENSPTISPSAKVLYEGLHPETHAAFGQEARMRSVTVNREVS